MQSNRLQPSNRASPSFRAFCHWLGTICHPLLYLNYGSSLRLCENVAKLLEILDYCRLFQLLLSEVITSPSYMLSVVNYAVNFPLYCLSARNFRQQFLLMVGIKPRAVVPVNPPCIPAVSAQRTSAPTQEKEPVEAELNSVVPA